MIFLDLKLPKVDGLEVLQRITRNNPTAVLATMGSKEGPTRVRAVIWKNQPTSVTAPRAAQVLPAEMRIVRETPALQDLGMYWLLLNNPPKG